MIDGLCCFRSIHDISNFRVIKFGECHNARCAALVNYKKTEAVVALMPDILPQYGSRVDIIGVVHMIKSGTIYEPEYLKVDPTFADIGIGYFLAKSLHDIGIVLRTPKDSNNSLHPGKSVYNTSYRLNAL